MSEPGDKLERAYRGLAREEPPAALDASILEASRRAVRPRSSSRWAVPVSIAAVVMLSVGVTLQMQREEPGIETSAPRSAPPPQPEPARAPEKEATPQGLPAPKPQRSPAAPSPARRDKLEQRAVQKPNADAAARVREEPPAAPPAVMHSAPVPFPAQQNAAPAADVAPEAVRSAPAPAAAGATVKRIAPLARPQAAEDQAIADPERELERIAQLRVQGRNPEADRALEEFRKRHPDYRIADAMWERVRPR